MPAEPQRARRLAEEILAGPEYQEPAKAWWQEVLEWVDTTVGRLLGSLTGSGGGRILGWLVVLIVLAGLAVLVVRLLIGLRRPSRTRTSEPREAQEPPVDWAAEAARLEADGQWRAGLRARYRALVAALAARRTLDPDASRTTGDHRRQVADAVPDVADEFTDAAELFDRAWYGGRPTGPEEAARFEELSRRVVERSR